MIDELQKLIAFKPVTSNTKASAALLGYVQKELAALGMQCELVEHNGYTSLLAGTQSLKSSTVLLQAHVDVVPAPDELFTTKRVGDKLYGRGTYDMLFSVVCFLDALRELHAAGELQNHDIGVMLTSDEEVGGFDGVGALAKDYTCDVCILPDAGGKNKLSVSGKGVLELEVLVKGSSGHAARPSEYDNPNVKVAQIIQKLAATYLNDNPEDTTYSITKVRGGEALNQVPHEARVFLDIRYVPGSDPQVITQDIEELLKGYDVTITQLVCEPAFANDPQDPYIAPFIELYESITGRTVEYINAPGSSDARFFPEALPIIMMRPDGGGLHAQDEFVSIEGMSEFTKVITAYLQQFAKIERTT